MTDVLIKGEIWAQRQTQQGELHVEMKAEVRVHLQAKGMLWLPANPEKLGERHRIDPPSQPQKELTLRIL